MRYCCAATEDRRGGIYLLVLTIICALGFGALYAGMYLREEQINREIDFGCKELGAIVIDGKFYSCEPKKWYHDDTQ